jgi:hypothetical protein
VCVPRTGAKSPLAGFVCALATMALAPDMSIDSAYAQPRRADVVIVVAAVGVLVVVVVTYSAAGAASHMLMERYGTERSEFFGFQFGANNISGHDTGL